MSDKKSAKSFPKRQTLKLVVGICLIAAVLMLTRAYFLQHPPSDQPVNLTTTELGLNPATIIESVNTQLSPATGVWGENISSAFALPGTSGFWIQIRTSQATYIGELSTAGFKNEFILPLQIQGLRLFSDHSLLYFTASTNTTDAQLVGIERGVAENLLTLPAGSEFNSVFFEPDQKQFYFNIYDKNGRSKFQVLRQNGTPQDVADSSTYSQPQIMNVDVLNNTLYFRTVNGTAQTCYSLNLTSKQIGTKDCGAVQTTDDGFIYATNSPNLSALNSDFKGHILQTNTANGNQQFIKIGDAGDVFGNLTRNADRVAVIYSRIESEAGSLKVLPVAVHVYVISIRMLERSIEDLPSGTKQLALDGGLKVCMITSDSQAGQKLWQEPLEAGQSWQEVKLDICTQTCDYTAL
jgi:hypothetical protein